MRIALIANEASGGGLDPEPLEETMRRHGADVRVYAPGDLDTVPGWEPERIAVAGGDGSIGGCAELAGRLKVPLAVIPMGTANDFARASALPTDPEEACVLAATGEQLRALELGRLGSGRPFVNVASAGLASAAAHRAQPLKPRLGPLAYAVGAIRAAASEPPLRFRVRADGGDVYAGEAWQAIVAVTGHFGGGAEIGVANPEDGVLDVTVLPAGSRLTLARRAWGMRRGTIAEQRDVCHARGHVIEVDLPPGTEFNVDGELLDDGMQRITVERDAFELVVG
ncbi:MAG: diacylglycerol kinase family protein [Solirubrobacteraceae bacterium]